MDQVARRCARERDLYRGLLKLNARTELEPFLEDALRLVVEVVEAEQGYLELFPTGDTWTEQNWWTAAGCSDDELETIRALVSRGIIAETLGAGEVIITPSAMLDPRFRDRNSVRSANIHAVLSAPIGKNPPLGVFYLQRRELRHMFSEEDRACAEIFVEQLAPLVHAFFERRRYAGGHDPTRPFRQRLRLDSVVGSSKALAALFREVELVAPLDVCVLLTGETGVGKSQIARLIHDNGPNLQRPFVEINCAALPETLIENELFGAVPGAHSTATRRVEGKIAAARGGTLFLDEIGELTPTAQAKLLQLLQTKEYYPLGAAQPVQSLARLIAATNVDLKKAVTDRRFREDLYYRLNVLPIRVPALSERREDIPILARHFCKAALERHRLAEIELSPATLNALAHQQWAGNVRELMHRIEAGAIRAAAENAPQVELTHLAIEPGGEVGPESNGTFHAATRKYQRQLLENALQASGGNVSEAARRLDLTRGHVYTLMKTLGMEKR
jgi:transcriptional regulator with GAF, ATPase, and Fis domain